MVLIAFLGTSCTKEEVAPCSRHNAESTDGAAKSEKPTLIDNPGNAGGLQGTVLGTHGVENGISDDGDDLSDSERSRKKPRQ